MDSALADFPQKTANGGRGRTLPHHLWPKSVKTDLSVIRERAHALRRLNNIAARNPSTTAATLSPENAPHAKLWQCVTSPVTIRTIMSPPLKDTGTLCITPHLQNEEDPTQTPSLQQAILACFKAL